MNRRTIRELIVAIAVIVPLVAMAAPGRRDGDRISVEGRVSRMDHDRDGYRVELDRGGYSFWVPERALRDRPGDFRIGISIRLGGVFRRGTIVVDAIDWPRNEIVRGVVERIDYRGDSLWVRDERTNRLIRADIRDVRRHDLRRGDFAAFIGQWRPGGWFDVERIDNVRPHREGWRP